MAGMALHDVHGRLVGVLDVSTESRAFGFDAAAVVGVYATSIENRLLQAQSDEHLVLHFQAAPALLGTPMEGLAGVDHGGRVVWVNATGHSLLGRPSRQEVAPVEELFGHGLAQLLPLCGATEALRLQLPSGLGSRPTSRHSPSGAGSAHTRSYQTFLPPSQGGCSGKLAPPAARS